MKTIKEILIFGGITVIITFLLNTLLAKILPDTFDLWIYDSLSSFIISVILIIFSLIIKENKNFDFFLRYSFSNFLLFTVHNFIFAIKISFGKVRFCVPEKISNEKLYETSFIANFIVFLSTFFFLVLFKERNVNIFTKNSVTYMVLIFILITVFRAQNLLSQSLNFILSIF
ncbi:hypothetical protein SAMN05421793_10119 [Epilithonimonas hominis]|uniref:Uncharacterized protein n=1 Tax=Epilithonimonas hominis TaxID=420404 RepID=A0A1H6HQG4_9FLAO|nr:hypothetical protein SAMN05421793_10119 [Epilithonimonas hominis]